MAGFIIRGRAAWIAGIILGVGLLLAGIFAHQLVLLVGGAAFLGLSIVFLIISFATKGAYA